MAVGMGGGGRREGGRTGDMDERADAPAHTIIRIRIVFESYDGGKRWGHEASWTKELEPPLLPFLDRHGLMSFPACPSSYSGFFYPVQIIGRPSDYSSLCPTDLPLPIHPLGAFDFSSP
jgi:hypothetical protein